MPARLRSSSLMRFSMRLSDHTQEEEPNDDHSRGHRTPAQSASGSENFSLSPSLVTTSSLSRDESTPHWCPLCSSTVTGQCLTPDEANPEWFWVLGLSLRCAALPRRQE